MTSSVWPMVGRRNIRLIYIATMFGNLTFQRAIGIIYLSERGFSLLQIGIFQAILHAATVVFEIPTGLVADLLGRKLSLILGRSLQFLFLLGMVFAGNVYVVAACYLVFGLGVTLVSGAEDALLYDSHIKAGGDEHATRLFGQYSAVITLSLAVAMAVGGLLRAFSWQLVYGASAACQVVALLLCVLLKEIPSTDKAERTSLTTHIRETVSFFKQGSAGRIMLLTVALYAGVSSTYHLMAQELLSNLGFKVAGVSMLFALDSLISAGISSKAHVVENWLGSKKVLVITLAATAIAFPLVAVNSRTAAIASFYVISLIYYLFEPVAQNQLNQRIPPQQRATLLSALSLTTSLVMMLLFPVIGYLADHVSVGAVLSGVGTVAMLLCVLGVLRFYSASSAQMKAFAVGSDLPDNQGM